MKSSIINLYQGNALTYLAGIYPKLDLVVLEYIQNAIDMNAQKVWVKIDFKNRNVSIKDDGDGTSVAHFERALSSVCKSIKAKDKLGRYGIGLISWIGKSKRMIFTSTSKTDPAAYKKWEFDKNAIEKGEVPYIEEPKLFFSRNGFKEVTGRNTVPWRTQVLLEGVIKDQHLTKISEDEFISNVLEKYSEVMRKKNISVFLTIVEENGERKNSEIKAQEFKGKKLSLHTEMGSTAGKSIFGLYIANKGARGRQGKVSIGIEGDDFRISFSTFAKSAGLLNQETVQLLSSGIFEGNIISQKCTLHPGRKGFAENDALVEFCEHIELWAEKVGMSYAAEISESKKDERYQFLGVKSMKVIEEILRNDKFQKLFDILKSGRVGSVGLHHFEKAETEIGKQDSPSLSVTSLVEIETAKPKKNKKKKGGTQQEPETDHPDHTPFSVIGPIGKKRIRVKGHSTGLQFSYEEMSGASDLWRFDASSGILAFNIRHPLWEAAEKNDTLLMRFQESIAIKVLNLETYPDEWREIIKAFISDELWGVLTHFEAMLPKKTKSIFGSQKKK
ncbi:MAG: ATP-binding protein [Patescibacteria group bacterium]|nr:ATP-binding protein [Patescibacteria group bacterium]